MKRGHWIGFGVVLLLLLGTTYFLVNALVGSYLSRQQVEERLEGISGREVRVESVSFSLWSGIRVEEVEISAYPDGERGTFMKARFISLSPDLWALLGGRLVVSSARVGGVEIQVSRERDGGWNLVRGFGAGGSTDAPRELPFAIRQLTFTDGEIRFRDEVIQRTVPLSFQRIRLEDYRPGEGGRVHFDNLILPRGNLVGRVRFNLREPSLTVLDLRINYVELKTVRPYLKPLLPPVLGSAEGTLNAHLEKLTVDSRTLHGVGPFTLDNIRMPDETPNGSPVTRLSFSGESTLDLQSGRLKLDVGDLQVNRRLLVRRLQGTLSPPWDNPVLGARVDLGDVRVESLLEWARWVGYEPTPGAWTLTGRLEKSDLSVSGRLFEPGFEGTATFSRLVFSGPGTPGEVPLESVELRLTKSGVEVVSARVPRGNEVLTLRGEVATGVPLTESRLNLTLSGSGLDAGFLQRVLTDWTPGGIPGVQVRGTIDEMNLTLKGPLRRPSWSARGNFGGVDLDIPPLPDPLTEVTGGWTVGGSGIRLDGMEGQYEEGSFTLGGWIPWSGQSERELSLRGSLLHFPAERLGSLLGREIGPMGVRLRGPISLREISIQGPIERLNWEGTIEPERIRVEHDRLRHALNQVQGRLHVRGRPAKKGPSVPGEEPLANGKYRVNVRGSLEGSYRGNPFSLEGGVPYPVDREDTFELRGHVERLPVELLNPLFERFGPTQRFSATGPVDVNEVKIEGNMDNPRLSGDFYLDDITVESSLLPGPVEGVTGRLQLDEPPGSAGKSRSRTREVSVALEADYRQRPLRIEGRFPYPFSGPGEYDVTLSAERVPLDPVLRVLPDTSIPGEVRTGWVALRDFRIRGPASRIRGEGEVRVRGGEVMPPFLREPIVRLRGTFRFHGDEIRVEQLRGELLEQPLVADGVVVRTEEGWTPRLNVRIKDLSIQPFLGSLSELPPLPPGWTPEGTFSSTVRLEGPLEKLRFRGEFGSPRLRFGTYGRGEARGSLTFEQGSLRLDSLRLPLFQGEYRGTLDFREGGEGPGVRLEGRVQSLKLGSLLPALTGVGQGSTGELNGTLEGRAPAGQLDRFTGTLSVEGDTLVFRKVEALKELSVLLNTNLTRVIETGLTRALLNLLTLNLKRSKKRIESLFGSEVTTRFDRGQVKVEFVEGEGTIRRLRLSNSEIEIRGHGTVWLDGRLDVRVEVKPRENLLNRIEETLLRSLITGGFPTLRIQGRFQDPQFDEQELRRGLQNQILGVVTGRGSSNDQPENKQANP